MVRPLLWMSVAFLVGVAAGGRLPEAWPVGAFVGVACGAFVAAVLAHLSALQRLRAPALLLALLTMMGAVAGLLAYETLPTPASLAPFFDRPGTLFLAELTAPADIRTDKARLTLRLHRAFHEGRLEPVGGTILLTLPLGPSASNPLPWNHGDWVLARLSLKRFQNFKNPGGFDYARSQAAKGVYARASLSDSRSLIRVRPPSFLAGEAEASWPSLQKRLDHFRQSGFFWLKRRLSPDGGDFYASLLLGYRIPPGWSERLSRSGVIHLLSISGLHLGLVSLCVFWLVRRGVRLFRPSLLVARSDQHYALWPAFLAAVAYALISGLALPTWRSLIMIALLMGSAFFYRFSDPFTALAAAALLIVLLSPESLQEISFQLSFLSMLGLFVVYPRLQSALARAPGRRDPDTSLIARILHPFVEAFLASIAASVLVMPVVVHHFHGISLAGFLANAVLVPLTGFTVLPLGLTALCLFAVHETLALPVLTLGAVFLEACLWLIKWFSDLPWAFYWVGDLSTSRLVALYVALGILFSPWARLRKLIAVACLAVVVGGGAVWERIQATEATRGTLRVTAIDVGQGSSTLVRFPGGQTMLVDGGGFPDESFDVGRMVLAPFLWREGIRKIDVVVLSHNHPDHRNGLRAILSHMEVGALWETGIHEGGPQEDELADIAQKRRVPVKKLHDLQSEQTIDGCRVRVLHPPASMGEGQTRKSLNNASLVLRIDYGETSVLLPGDIDQSVERELLPALQPSEEVLLVAAHHGSETSNSRPFLEALNPRAVMVSCGSDNPFGFPSERLLTWCRTRGAPCFRTDLQGAVEGVSDGSHWRVRSLVSR